jgi:hypothetical protein
MNTRKRVLLTGTAIIACLLLAGQAAAGPRFYGANTGTWAARWWQWAFAQPADASHPLFDATGENCMGGQAPTGYVFLSGVYFDDTDPTAVVAHRDCAIPAGRGLFFPVVNNECSSIEAGTIWGGTDEDSLNECLDAWSFEGWATLDGHDLSLVEARSGVYEIDPLPDPNLLGAPGGTDGISMTNGLFGRTVPLAAGEHDLAFEGVAHYDGSAGGDPFAFTIAVTYTLTVG